MTIKLRIQKFIQHIDLFDSYTIWYTRHMYKEKVQKLKQQIDIIADSIQ